MADLVQISGRRLPRRRRGRSQPGQAPPRPPADQCGGDELTDDDILLQTGQRIDLALMAASVSTRVVSWKGGGGQEGLVGQSSLVMPSSTC